MAKYPINTTIISMENCCSDAFQSQFEETQETTVYILIERKECKSIDLKMIIVSFLDVYLR